LYEKVEIPNPLSKAFCKDSAVATIPVKLDPSPWNDPENDPDATTLVSVSPSIVVTVSPKLILVFPIVIELFSKLAFGIADNPNVKVSVPASAEIVKPSPEAEAKFKDPVIESANRFTPSKDAVANPLTCPRVPAVKYPASLLSCEISLPDTTSFFQFAMFYYVFVLLINIPNY
jgi:hypothetical protein